MTAVVDTASRGEKQPLAVRAVERAAKALAGRGSTRRRFLYRAAVVGSALAADPLGYVLKPQSAYASVCGSGLGCGAGWSVFCCTINEGKNTCPPHAFVAGWWKVDASAFCLGSPRYYIDCNRRPRARCRCRCNDTGCDHRRVCCNVFRYGQCNTQIGGVTEVVCRVITCTPPWQWDPACGRTVRTDNETRSHTSRCLPGKDPTRIELLYQDMGLRGSVLGDPINRERDAADGGRKRRYENGIILWHRRFGANAVYRRFAVVYEKLDFERGPLGYPITSHRELDTGTLVRFQNGGMYRHPDVGVRAVHGPIHARYRDLGGPRGRLGWPTSHTRISSGDGKVTDFQLGAIFDSPDTDPMDVTGRTLEVYRSFGGAGGTLGFPIKPQRHYDDGGVRQRFQHGAIAGPSPRRVFMLRQQFWSRWRDLGAQTGPWGYPVAHTSPVGGTGGFHQPFERVQTYWKTGLGVHWISGGVYAAYVKHGGPTGRLGFPVEDQQKLPDGSDSAKFEHGTIVYEPGRGATVSPSG